MRRPAPHSLGVNLFPFLAVLICTMGVMLLLLVFINRPGGAADQIADEEAAAGHDGGGGASSAGTASTADADHSTTAEMLKWKLSQLEISRQKTEDDLADRRLRLSSVEDNIRALGDQWKQLQQARRDLAEASDAKAHDQQAIAGQIERLKGDVETTKRQVAGAVERARTEGPSFAIIPYDGHSGTQRRPLYVECSEDGIVLQPEGIRLTETDFDGPLGPGNPLASTLRAARDYLVRGQPPAAISEPYPLMLVRPNGIGAFYVARAAMGSWASDFGYELIEAKTKLAYPPPDPQLVQIEQAALAEARERYKWFAQTETGRETHARSHPAFRATSHGVVREGGPVLSDESDSGTPGLGSGGAEHGPGGTGVGPGGNGLAGSGAMGSGVPGSGIAGNGPGGNGPGGNGPGGNGPGGNGPGGNGLAGNGLGGNGLGGNGLAGNGPRGIGAGGNGVRPGGPDSGVGTVGGTPSAGGPPGSGGATGGLALAYLGGPGGAGGTPNLGNYPGLGGPTGNGGPPGFGGPATGNGLSVVGNPFGSGGPTGLNSASGQPGGVPGLGGDGASQGAGSGPGAGVGTNGPGTPYYAGTGPGGIANAPGGTFSRQTNGVGSGSIMDGGTGTVGGPLIGTAAGGGIGNGLLGGPGIANPASATPSGTPGVPAGSVPLDANGQPQPYLAGPGGTIGQAARSTVRAQALLVALREDRRAMVLRLAAAAIMGRQALPAASGGPMSSMQGDGSTPEAGMPAIQLNPLQKPNSVVSDDVASAAANPQLPPSGPHPGEWVDPQQFAPPKPPSDKDSSKDSRSLADKRGNNWTLPATARNSTPVSRPIHIECRGDGLTLLPDYGNPRARNIPFGQRTGDSVDKLVAAVWDYTKGWGIAGKQMYWRPILVLQLGPSGEARYAELQQLLAHSGLEVERR